MANQGKRMVKENLIAQIGQATGGVTDVEVNGTSVVTEGVAQITVPNYDAGTGIDITANTISANVKAGSGIVVDTDLTDDSLVVMIDQEDIPYKSDLNKYFQMKSYVYDQKPADFISEVTAEKNEYDLWFESLPVLRTVQLTDSDPFLTGRTIIETDQDNLDAAFIRFKGSFIIRNSSADTYSIFSTTSAKIDGASAIIKDFILRRSGNNDYQFQFARWSGLDSLSGQSTTYDVYRVTRAFQDLQVSVAGIGFFTVPLRINNPKVNVNMPTTTPTTAGTYVLKATVDANGQVSAIEWVAEV